MKKHVKVSAFRWGRGEREFRKGGGIEGRKDRTKGTLQWGKSGFTGFKEAVNSTR